MAIIKHAGKRSHNTKCFLFPIQLPMKATPQTVKCILHVRFIISVIQVLEEEDSLDYFQANGTRVWHSILRSTICFD